ncbi:MAG: FAD-dependent oxidoreductase, partial [Halanaeroarchaeum sp.]
MTDDHVVVVGAGVVGVSVAAHLVDADTTVTLLDKGHVAGETTGKAAGFVYHQFHEPAD